MKTRNLKTLLVALVATVSLSSFSCNFFSKNLHAAKWEKKHLDGLTIEETDNVLAAFGIRNSEEVNYHGVNGHTFSAKVYGISTPNAITSHPDRFYISTNNVIAKAGVRGKIYGADLEKYFNATWKKDAKDAQVKLFEAVNKDALCTDEKRKSRVVKFAEALVSAAKARPTTK